jgi:hypothetical protein
MTISQNPVGKTGAESGKILDTNVIDNFETFSKSLNTPSYDQQFRSYDQYKLGVLDLDRLSYLDQFGP